MSSEFVFDVTTAAFESEVITRSQQVPVLLDFWADWCGPCKTLRPILDALAEEYGGAFLLGAVNTEVEQDLAYAFQVQSIPFCVLVVAGRPVDAFSGALPESEIRQFLARAGVEPGDEPAEGTPTDPEADKLAAARSALIQGEWGVAAQILRDVPDDDDAAAVAKRILDGLSIFEAEIDAGESTAAAEALRGRDAFAAGQAVAGVEAWLDSVAADRAWRGGIARQAAVMGFEALAVNDAGREVVRELRSKLATLLY